MTSYQGQNSLPACFPGWGLYHPDECKATGVAEANPSGPGGVLGSPNLQFHNKHTPCMPSPFAPHGGAQEWQTNELLIKDPCLRALARVTPLDCGITATYTVNPVPKY